ncbi:hypothetical protein [Nostocoides jenkinsii]|jgi:hypothetical protein|uniref:Uncharacterized protein n=1 Tax=Nostocoides jenkinsii Ben 74 TaxID=1193518 RepID=A0A077MF77_9MICO|nr:hypothetical protein [Tetrasphaera jenkinsii]CCI54680.1 exported hypothetical protein [Tetrasphaera jenkinsii Ben 74]
MTVLACALVAMFGASGCVGLALISPAFGGPSLLGIAARVAALTISAVCGIASMVSLVALVYVAFRTLAAL